MRITLCTHNLNIEGAPRSLFLLAKGLQNSGHDCHVFSPYEGPLAKDYAKHKIHLKIIPELFKNKERMILSELKRSADIVIINTIHGFSLVDQCKKFEIPTIWIIRESEFFKYKVELPDLSNSAISNAPVIVFPSNACAQMYSDCLNNNEHIIPNGINIEEVDAKLRNFNPQAKRQELRLPLSTPIVTLVGTICPNKGQYEFIQASLRIIHETTQQPITFLIMGGTRNGKHEQYIERAQNLVNTNGVRAYVRFLPESDDALEIMALSDICVCPSFIETCPRVVLEAMTCRRPIIASSTYGIPELIEDGIHGLLIPPGHAGLLADKIRTLITDPDLALKLTQNARTRIEKEFSHQLTVQRFIELIASVDSSKQKLM
ncbi:glycosyltransferase family 4 protein [Patescibacteria group bacterium]|nr:glycosyltransferase family 4 protein [Patescibacteria group bacterium]